MTGLTGIVLATSFAACAEASGDVRGGDVLITPKPAAYLGCDVTETRDAGTGDKWSDLYRDLFAANGAGGCAAATCHGSEDGAGVKASGFRCGSTKEACLKDILDYRLVTREFDPAEPDSSQIMQVLRHCDESRETVGFMPKQPASYYFSKASIARIRSWIAKGAPDD
jgi:hypothetical protein